MLLESAYAGPPISSGNREARTAGSLIVDRVMRIVGLLSLRVSTSVSPRRCRDVVDARFWIPEERKRAATSRMREISSFGSPFSMVDCAHLSKSEQAGFRARSRAAPHPTLSPKGERVSRGRGKGGVGDAHARGTVSLGSKRASEKWGLSYDLSLERPENTSPPHRRCSTSWAWRPGRSGRRRRREEVDDGGRTSTAAA